MANLLKKDLDKLDINGFLVKSMGKWLTVTGIFMTDKETNDFCEKNKDHGVVACFGPIIITANLYDIGQNVTIKEK